MLRRRVAQASCCSGVVLLRRRVAQASSCSGVVLLRRRVAQALPKEAGAVALNDGKRSSKFPWGQVSEWWHQIVDEPYPALEPDSSSALFRVFGAGLMSPHDARATEGRIM